MIVPPKSDDPYTPLLSGEPHASSSNVPPPPPFEDVASHLLLPVEDAVIPQYGEDQPPAFAPYEAEYFADSNGDIISHDPHLNQDGEALYRFILSHAYPPGYVLHIHGQHDEHRTRYVSSSDSNRSSRVETYTETIVDFDFKIDIGQTFASKVVHWTIADSEPAYRGKMYLELESPDKGRRKATRKERKESAAWNKFRKLSGLPPWIGKENVNIGEHLDPLPAPESHAVLQSSKTLREWADDYCNSNRLLKEFTYEKIVYGWHLANLTEAIQTIINSTHYSGKTKIDYELSSSKIHIRPNARLSRALSNKWIKFLLWILFIYPFIWLYKRFHARGGGYWRVSGGAYALKQWQHVPGSYEGEDVAQFLIRTEAESGRKAPITQRSLRKLMKTQRGVSELVGTREGEWFREWEGTIRRAVQARLKQDQVMVKPDDTPGAGVWLDGYND